MTLEQEKPLPNKKLLFEQPKNSARKSVDNVKEEVKEVDEIQPNAAMTENKHLNSIRKQFSSFNVKREQDSFSTKTQEEQSKEFIRNHAFISSSFKSNLVENR
jgi:hypothetical protein